LSLEPLSDPATSDSYLDIRQAMVEAIEAAVRLHVGRETALPKSRAATGQPKAQRLLGCHEDPFWEACEWAEVPVRDRMAVRDALEGQVASIEETADDAADLLFAGWRSRQGA
jgi:hypothetical protein